jgi:hypothetical protein
MLKVMQMLAQGYTTTEIGPKLGYAPMYGCTVAYRARWALGAHTNEHLVALALSMGLIEAPKSIWDEEAEPL